MKIAILGGCGAMGSVTARDLLSKASKGIDKVIVADVDLKKGSQLTSELKDSRFEFQQLNITDKEKTCELLKTVDACLNGLPTVAGYQMDIFNYCLETKCPYTDYGGLGIYTTEQKKLHQKFVERGVPAILGLGEAPGLSNIMAKICAERLDKVEKISMIVAWKDMNSVSPVFVPPYSILTIMSEYVDTNVQYIDGKYEELPAISGSLFVDLPHPFGRYEVVHSRHSETTTVPISFKDKGIKEVTWRLNLGEELDNAMRVFAAAGFGDKEPLQIKGVEVLPVEFLEKLIQRNIQKNEEKIIKHSYYEILFAIGEGEKGGKRTKITSRLASSPEQTSAGLTSICASIGVQMLAKGEIMPGTWAPEECIDTEEFSRELKKRNFHMELVTEEEM